MATAILTAGCKSAKTCNKQYRWLAYVDGAPAVIHDINCEIPRALQTGAEYIEVYQVRGNRYGVYCGGSWDAEGVQLIRIQLINTEGSHVMLARWRPLI
jgi:hypothetical protein